MGNKRYEQKLQEIYDLSKKGGCMVCGEKDLRCLDLHHRFKQEKVGTFHRMIRDGQKTLLIQEIKKCVVLCSNCHRKLHGGVPK